jgi:hypothetical protein
MNDYQRLALENHCRFAFETAQPRLARVLKGGRFSTILSVNSGYE